MDHRTGQRPRHQHDRLAPRLSRRAVQHAERQQPRDSESSRPCVVHLFEVSYHLVVFVAVGTVPPALAIRRYLCIGLPFVLCSLCWRESVPSELRAGQRFDLNDRHPETVVFIFVWDHQLTRSSCCAVLACPCPSREIKISAFVEFGPMVTILTSHCTSKAPFNRLTAVDWVHEFIKLGVRMLDTVKVTRWLLFSVELLLFVESVVRCR